MVALATPSRAGAIAIIRISGQKLLPLIPVFKSSRQDLLEKRRIHRSLLLMAIKLYDEYWFHFRNLALHRKKTPSKSLVTVLHTFQQQFIQLPWGAV
jgi:hypothetical protein